MRSARLGTQAASRHQDLAGADQFGDAEGAKQRDERIELVAGPEDAQDDARRPVVDDLRVEVLGDLKATAIAIA